MNRSEILFTCAYHGGISGPAPAAHVFPKVLGGVLSSSRTVCGPCNHEVNSRVENPALPFFAFYRSVWGIGGRFDQIPAVPAEVRFPDGRTLPVELGPDGEVRRAIVTAETRPDGGRRYFVFGPTDKIEDARERIDRRRSGVRWEGGTIEGAISLRIRVDDAADKTVMRRLATKIAFERAAILRGGDFMSSTDFKHVRSFILDGAEAAPVCGLVADRGVYADGGPMDFGLSRHAVVVTAQQDVFGAVVVLFGLFYFWVILARPYAVLAPWDDVMVEDPQRSEVQTPAIRGALGTFLFPWDSWVRASVERSDATRRQAFELAMGRLDRGWPDEKAASPGSGEP